MKMFNISICYTLVRACLLGALADQLQVLDSHVEIVVIGGSALTALGLVRRATRDVDLLAIAENGELHLADELTAAARWSITQDPSPGYRLVLVDALRVLGVDDADLGD